MSRAVCVFVEILAQSSLHIAIETRRSSLPLKSASHNENLQTSIAAGSITVVSNISERAEQAPLTRASSPPPPGQSLPLTALAMSVSESPSAAARRSVTDTVTQLQAKLSTAQDTLTRKTREIDVLTLQHNKETTHLRTLFAHYLMRLHIRSHKTKRILMQLHLTALEMDESLVREEQRAAAAGSTDHLQVYDEKAGMVSKTTLRKLAHLYRKRPLHITAELDDKFTHEIKTKFFYFLNNYQSLARENESLFLRNVALTKETLDYKQQAEDDRKERDKSNTIATEKTEKLDAATRELDELRKRVVKLEREDEIRKKKEAARAVAARTEQYSKAFRGVTVDVSEEKEPASGGGGSDSPLSPTPRSVDGSSSSGGGSSSALFVLSPSAVAAGALTKRMTAGGSGLPSLEAIMPQSPKVASNTSHPLATPTKSNKRNTANARQLASISTKRSNSPPPRTTNERLMHSPLTPATPSSARDKSPKTTSKDDNGGGSSLPAIVSPRGAKR